MKFTGYLFCNLHSVNLFYQLFKRNEFLWCSQTVCFVYQIQDLLLDSSRNITNVSKTLALVAHGAMQQASVMTGTHIFNFLNADKHCQENCVIW